MLDWIASNLSSEQQAPLLRTSLNACILAAAGSGKTRTLVHALAADLADGIEPEAIVAFTFTEKAGEELLARVHTLAAEHLPGSSVEGMYIGTIHAWCFSYLTQQDEFINCTPLDELHVDSLVARVYDRLGLEEAYGLAFPSAIGRFLVDLEVFYNEHLALEDVPDQIRPCVGAYLEMLRRNRLMDFGGMIRWATEHLQANGPVAGLASLFVDEYQDVNPAQVALVKAMLPARSRLVVVGDDLQCIYNWRGSDVGRILNFRDDFGESSTFRLLTNYRSRPSLVQLSNRIAEHVSMRDAKKVMTAERPEVSCATAFWLSSDSDAEQAEQVAELVELFASEGVPWNRIAILVRSVLGWGRPIVEALSARGIPVYCPILTRGGAFIDGLLLPVLDWLRTEHGEPRNAAEEAETEEAANALWDTVREWLSGVEDGETVFWGATNEWLDTIEEARNEAYDVRGHLYEFLDSCQVRVGPRDGSLMLGLSIASQIIRSVEEIERRRLVGSPRRTPRGVMSEVYHALLRNRDDFGESVPIDTSADAVLVTTVHQAKGLEWPVVIIPSVQRGRFPVRSRAHGSSFPDSVAGRYGTSEGDERRLLYVATTRGRERLFLLDPVSGDQKRVSPFLRELPGNQLSKARRLAEIDDDVWSISPEDLVESDPAPLRIALSDVLIYVECPFQFALRRVVGVQPSVGDELGFGKGLHEVIQLRSSAERPWSTSELQEHVNNRVSLPYMSEEGEAEARRAILVRLKGLEGLGVFTGAGEQEVRVEVLFEGGIVHGVADCLQGNADGTLVLTDWKSNIHEIFAPRYERQMQFYAHAVVNRGGCVERADIVDVGASSAQGQLVVRKVDVADNALRALAGSIEQALEGIWEGRFEATPSTESCAACDMYRICAGRCNIDGT